MISTIYCFFVVNFGWVLFRADNTLMGLRYISRMIMPWRHLELSIPAYNYMDSKTVFIGMCAVFGMGFGNVVISNRIANKWKNSIIEAVYCVILLVLCLSSIASDTYNPFIYFQF